MYPQPEVEANLVYAQVNHHCHETDHDEPGRLAEQRTTLNSRSVMCCHVQLPSLTAWAPSLGAGRCHLATGQPYPSRPELP
jgi:hypothetical protein